VLFRSHHSVVKRNQLFISYPLALSLSSESLPCSFSIDPTTQSANFLTLDEPIRLYTPFGMSLFAILRLLPVEQLLQFVIDETQLFATRFESLKRAPKRSKAGIVAAQPQKNLITLTFIDICFVILSDIVTRETLITSSSSDQEGWFPRTLQVLKVVEMPEHRDKFTVLALALSLTLRKLIKSQLAKKIRGPKAAALKQIYNRLRALQTDPQLQKSAAEYRKAMPKISVASGMLPNTMPAFDRTTFPVMTLNDGSLQQVPNRVGSQLSRAVLCIGGCAKLYACLIIIVMLPILLWRFMTKTWFFCVDCGSKCGKKESSVQAIHRAQPAAAEDRQNDLLGDFNGGDDESDIDDHPELRLGEEVDLVVDNDENVVLSPRNREQISARRKAERDDGGRDSGDIDDIDDAN